MANTKSAEKRNRQAAARQARNRARRSRMRTAVKKVRVAVAGGDAEQARTLLQQAVGVIDATAQKGVIHRNTAARTKSRLSRAVASLGG